jgi:septal ring-binding cell division protein DamX
MKVSVMNAFRNAGDSKHFFILNITRDNRRCYLVLFGIYPNKKSAESSLKSVPEYFWKQTNPPKVLDLSGYL